MSKQASDRLTGANMCLGKAGLTAVAAATTLTYAAINISLNGRMYTAAAATAQASPTTDAQTKKAFLPLAAGQSCIFVICVDKAGARFAVQGAIGSEADFASSAGALEFPSQIPESICPIGYLVVRAGSTAVGNWTFSSNNFSGVTGVTVVAQDVCWLPSASINVTLG